MIATSQSQYRIDKIYPSPWAYSALTILLVHASISPRYPDDVMNRERFGSRKFAGRQPTGIELVSNKRDKQLGEVNYVKTWSWVKTVWTQPHRKCMSRFA